MMLDLRLWRLGLRFHHLRWMRERIRYMRPGFLKWHTPCSWGGKVSRSTVLVWRTHHFKQQLKSRSFLSLSKPKKNTIINIFFFQRQISTHNNQYSWTYSVKQEHCNGSLKIDNHVKFFITTPAMQLSSYSGQDDNLVDVCRKTQTFSSILFAMHFNVKKYEFHENRVLK